MSRLRGPAIALLILIAAVLRLIPISGDFWLDEIWSYHIADRIVHPWNVLTAPVARYDNNHPLNTLLMWLMGHPAWPTYRLPALAAGIGSVILAWVVMRRRSSLDALVAVLLLGFSYPLVFYSSEARGYALAVFFALAGYDAMDRILRGGGWIAPFVFVASSILGILSHLTFVFFYLGALAWHAASIRRKHRWGSFLLVHVIPIAAIAMVYILFIRNLTIGGAPREGLFTGLLSAIGTMFGAGDPLLIAWITASCGVLLLGLSISRLKRQNDALWILLLVTVILAPAVIVGAQLLLVQQDNPIAARYFVVPGTFALLGIGTLLSDWLSRTHAARAAAIVLLLGFVGINLAQTLLFFRGGRGHYRDAIAYISENTPGDLITVLSDHPLRTGMVLDFYADRFLSPNQRLVIYDGSTLQGANFEFGPPLWIIVHSNKRNLPPEKLRGYVFDREFSYYGLSGYSWYLYYHHTLK